MLKSDIILDKSLKNKWVIKLGKINVLNKHIAELIAAGEVVERPSSVIKELVENCIDAKATSITVEIKDGGTTFMRVTDNGSGLYKDDVPKAFLRNATSKVKTQGDLDNISTLGFRGEALASICAVAKVELITCVKGEKTGTRYEINGGEEVFYDDFGCAYGTTIIVRDIFYNTPARMKFLKKNVSEANSIAGVLDRVALSHPDVSIKFIRDGKQTLSTPGNGDLYSCIYSVYGKQFVETLIPLSYEYNEVKVSGYVSLPTKSRASRSMQHFFINGRYVKTRTAMVALEEAFKHSIMTGKFPACVMFIEVPFDCVDVNVHPAKIEVRFADERPVFEAVYHGVKSALLKGDVLPDLQMGNAKTDIQDIAPIIDEFPVKKAQEKTVDDDDSPEVFVPKRANILPKPDIINIPSTVKTLPDETIKKEVSKPKIEVREEKVIEPYREVTIEKQTSIFEEKKKENKNDIRVIGEVFKTYIVTETSDGQILLIDKHAAHERIIYEKIKSERHEEHAQVLLIPKTVTLDKEEYNAVISNLDVIRKTGFEVEDFGSSMVRVRTAPIYLTPEDIEPSIVEMASYLKQNKKDVTTNKIDWIYHNVSCRAAIKAGTPLKQEEMLALVKTLKENEKIRYCPHGRPVFITIKKRDIEKQFGRIM